jgi:hypothetical protein
VGHRVREEGHAIADDEGADHATKSADNDNGQHPLNHEEFCSELSGEQFHELA